MGTTASNDQLDTIDHVAIQVSDIDRALQWYQARFRAEVLYRDDSWALLRFLSLPLAMRNLRDSMVPRSIGPGLVRAHVMSGSMSFARSSPEPQEACKEEASPHLRISDEAKLSEDG